MSDMLNADELGEVGERHFQKICAAAKLTCNQANRDRTGWDFIVEFPFEPLFETTALDLRQIPPSCHVQVKTSYDANDRVKFRLTSLERLAKEPKPSFIYVLKIDTALEFTGAYLIHLLDTPMEVVLKRLRGERPEVNSPHSRSEN